MLVMTNIGVVDFSIGIVWFYIYPIFFVIIGFKWLIDYLRKKGGSWVAGSFFIIFGSLLIMDRLGLIMFTFWDVFKLWPLLIVYIGFSLIRRKGINIIYDSDNDSEYANSSVFSFGDYTFNRENWKVEPMNLKMMAGEFYFDFSKAFVPEKKIPISLHSLAGDVNILMPEQIDFRVHATVKAGELKILNHTAEGINRTISFQTPGYDTAVRKIDFKINLKAGSIRIENV